MTHEQALFRIEKLEIECGRLETENEGLRAVIADFNRRMDAVPVMKRPPRTAPEGLRFLVKWFDAMFESSPGDGSDRRVQLDLHHWADDWEEMVKALKIYGDESNWQDYEPMYGAGIRNCIFSEFGPGFRTAQRALGTWKGM